MKTLVTGGTGFVGLNIVEALLSKGEHVVVLSDRDLPATASRVLGALPGTLSTVRADIADARAVREAFSEHAPQRIVHAAVITAGESRELTDFDRVIDVNFKGTAHVLAAAAEHGAARGIYVSSGSAYGAALYGGAIVTEETPPQPDTLYAITKHASERLCARYRQLRGLDVVCVRLGSVFGPWERDTGVRDTLSLAYQILQLARRGEDVILPQREPQRDWIYSRDAASGIARLLDSRALRYTLYNLSAGREWPQFARRWCSELCSVFPNLRCGDATGDEQPNVGFLGHVDRALMSIDRIRADTGFVPAYDDATVYSDYIAWLRAGQPN